MIKHLLTLKTLFSILIIAGAFFSSCEKDKMIPPTIDFKTGPGYTSADTHIALNTDFTVGVDAKRTEENDDLKTFTVTVSCDGMSDVAIATDTLTSAQAGEFTKDYALKTRDAPGTEKYSFTVTNRDGLITTESITITVP